MSSTTTNLLNTKPRVLETRTCLYSCALRDSVSQMQNLLHRQRRSVQDRKERYDNGLLKLADTEEQVAQMQVDLEELQPKLKEATIATDALLVQIAKDTEVANEKKAVVEKEVSATAFWCLPAGRGHTIFITYGKRMMNITHYTALQEVICNAQAEESRALKASCEADLAEALPALESAVSALKSLSKGDIVEVRVLHKIAWRSGRNVGRHLHPLVFPSNDKTLNRFGAQVKAMKKPPAAVKLVMEAVCIMMGVKPDKIKDPNGGNKKIDDYWGPAQKNLLGDSRFLQNLMDYDKDNMDSTMVEKVRHDISYRICIIEFADTSAFRLRNHGSYLSTDY